MNFSSKFELIHVVKAMESNYKKALKRFLKRNKTKILIGISVVVLFLIPPFINLIINTEAIFFSDFFGYINSENKTEWISFYGSIIGGMITLIGVAWTIVDQNKQREKDIKDSVRPILVASACKNEKILTDGRGKVFECELEYKNIGKGILYNPKVINVQHFVDGEEFGNLHLTLSLKNYLDVGHTTSDYISILFTNETLAKIYKSLHSKRNTIPMQVNMYIGGKDIYGRDIITKLEYKSNLIFRSIEKIELPLMKGEVISITLFDEEIIHEVLNHANRKYDGHY